MNRESAYMKILQSTAQFQRNIAIMLEAKAAEAEKSRSWLCNHLTSAAYGTHIEQIEQALQIHDQMIEVIDALTRMENALGKNMHVLLGDNQPDENSGIQSNNF